MWSDWFVAQGFIEHEPLCSIGSVKRLCLDQSFN